MDFLNTDGIDDLTQYRINSRREIVSILRNVSQKKQLVRMVFNKGTEAIVTSILEIDPDSESVIIDRAPERLQNDRILASSNLSFETMLDRIRILFFAPDVESCIHDNAPAYRFQLPASLVRLQRREFYRVYTPGCRAQIPVDTGRGIVNVTVPMRDLSAGGIGIVDEQMILDDMPGRVYTNCQLVLSDNQTLAVNLEVRNSLDVKLASGKYQRRLGFAFHEPKNSLLTAVQRVITKIEREQNAKATGMA